jgi:hypothetical protein
VSETCDFGCGPSGPEYVNAGVGVVPACPVHGWFAPFVDSLVAERERYKQAMGRAMDELGVPDGDYPAPVSNAYYILDAAIKEAA